MLPQLLAFVFNLLVRFRRVWHINPAFAIQRLLFYLFNFLHLLIVILIIFFLHLRQFLIDVNILDLKLIVPEVTKARNI